MHGDWPFLRPHERVPEVLVKLQKNLLKLEKNQEILPSRLDEALFHCSISREITHSLLNLKRVLHTLSATQEVPQHIHRHSRGTLRSRCNSRGTPFSPPQLKMRVPFPASLGKVSRRSRRISRGGSLNRKVKRNSRGSPTVPKDAQMSQSTPVEPDLRALP